MLQSPRNESKSGGLPPMALLGTIIGFITQQEGWDDVWGCSAAVVPGVCGCWLVLNNLLWVCRRAELGAKL